MILNSGIAALGHLYNEAALPIIERYNEHSDQDVRFSVACSLGHSGTALIPVFWGVAAMVLFNVLEGVLSVLLWKAVYLTCPFWAIEGYKSLFLMPLLNGLLYACLAVLLMNVPRLRRR